MIRVAICDDDKVFVGHIETMILDVCKKENIAIETDVFYSSETLQKEIFKGTQYDLLYLDIRMKNEDGITAAKKIRNIDENTLIIYVSGHERYMIELFQLDVFAFIKKPIEEASFINIFMEAYKKICNKQFYFSYRYKSVEYKILSKDILYFESKGRQVTINLRNGTENSFNAKLNDVESKLEKGKIPFLRIHQSYLVNYHLIKSRSKTEVTMVNGKSLPISEERQKIFNREYGKLLGGELGEL